MTFFYYYYSGIVHHYKREMMMVTVTYSQMKHLRFINSRSCQLKTKCIYKERE